jgi:hypothetical protein
MIFSFYQGGESSGGKFNPDRDVESLCELIEIAPERSAEWHLRQDII